ncbi:unnamed protein product [Closterium sp. Naga37s-1]|nr:unnamed protein product [Closterium sp. Naga37s-1]
MIPRALLSWRKRLGTVHGARDHKAGSKLARHAADILPSHAGKAGYEAPPECEKGAAASAVQWRPWIVRCAAGLLALVVVRFLLVANEAWVDSLELRNFSPLDALPAVAWEAGRRVPLGLVALGLSTRLFQSVLCILSLPEFFPSPHPPEPQAWVDSLELWNFFPLQSLPAVAWEEAPPRPGCIVTLDSRYSPEGVAAVEAAVARLLRELGVEAEEVGGGGGGREEGGGERIGGEGIRGEGLGGERVGGEEVEREGIGAGVGDGGQEGRRGGIGGRDEGEVDGGEVGRGVRDGKGRLLKEGGGDGEGRWHGGWRGRRLQGGDEERKGEGEGEGEGEGGLNGDSKAELGNGEGEGEGKAEGTDEGKGEGKDEGKEEVKDENSKVKEDGGGRGREAMPEAWRRFYSGLPKVVDAEGHENMWKFPIWVALAVNMCVCAAASCACVQWCRHVSM